MTPDFARVAVPRELASGPPSSEKELKQPPSRAKQQANLENHARDLQLEDYLAVSFGSLLIHIMSGYGMVSIFGANRISWIVRLGGRRPY